MMMALDAVASRTSDSLMAPMPVWMIRIFTSSFSRRSSESLNASTEPPTSPFTMTGSSWISPSLIWSYMSSRVMGLAWRNSCSLRICRRRLPISLASDSDSTTAKESPTWGMPENPMI